MTRLRRFWVRNTRCRIDYCKLDWLMVQMTGTRRCQHCEAAMPEPRATVGTTHPDLGD